MKFDFRTVALIKNPSSSFGVSLGCMLAVSAICMLASWAGADDLVLSGQWKTTSQTGRIVIPTSFDQCLPFRKGVAAVSVANKWGFINRLGQFVIEPIYDGVSLFDDGVAVAGIGGENGKSGLISLDGRFVVNPKFSKIIGPLDGVYAVWETDDGPSYYIDKYGHNAKAWGDLYFDGLRAVQNVDGKFGFEDREHNYKIKPQFEFAYPFEKGLAKVAKGGYGTKGPARWGFIDTNGTVVVYFQFDNVESFSEGLAAARIGDYKTGKWGFIDKSGNFVVNPQFDFVRGFNEGLAAVVIGNKTGFIDRSGNIIIQPQFDSSIHHSESFSDGLSHVTVGGKCGYLSR